LALALGPALGLVLGSWVASSGASPAAAYTAGITALCATYWILEPIAIPATSLIPFFALPLSGVLSQEDVATAYGHPIILLLLGGFLLSKAMEQSGAHRRLALHMVRLTGGRGGRPLVLAFMVAAGLLSMWISNTATTLMLLPVAGAIIAERDPGTPPGILFLGIAYACSIGGLATPIGTPPNVIFMAAYQELTGAELAFIDWMKFGVPIVLVFLPTAWWLLTRNIPAAGRLKMPEVGPFCIAERRVLWIFGLTAIAWMSRTEPLGGWSKLFGLENVTDTTVALTAAGLLFVMPDGKDGRLLEWSSAKEIPWGLLILFAGGLAIAKAFVSSGLSELLGNALGGLSTLPLWLLTLVLCLAVTFLTEVTSNTATATLLMPILGAAALAAQVEPRLLMIPAALSASCAFMLPVATAPNAIVYGSGHVESAQMARHGFALNLVGAFVLTGLCLLLL
jgi:sodium-dependent dicarboxylate transporter 2/3/5